MNPLPPERSYEKYAWTLIVATAIFRLFGSLPSLFVPQLFVYGFTGEIGTTGRTFTQYPWVLDYAVPYERLTGVFNLSMAIFILAVTLKSFRREERWAWYVLWLNPFLWIYQEVYLATATTASFPIPNLVAAVVGLLGLLLPIRKFFSEKQLARTPHSA